MARLANEMDLAPVIEAAQRWISDCLIEDGSLFSTSKLWTAELVGEAKRAFVDHPDASKDDFITKLKRQMKSASSPAQKLISEMLWALLLFPSNINAKTKRLQVRDVWSLSGEQLPEDLPLLSEKALAGIGSGGTGFNTQRWRELVFLISLAGDLKQRSTAERKQIFSNYDSFVKWIDIVPRDGDRQLRHMLRFFVFPDRVERMSSNRERCAVLEGFRIVSLKETRKWTDRELDDALLKLRDKLQSDYPNQILDFYEPPLREQWQPEGDTHPATHKTQAASTAALLPTQPDTAVYFETTKSSHLHGGPGWEYGTCLWSPSARVDGVDEYAIMRDVKTSDLVVHCEDSKVTGYSFATGPYREVEEEPPNPGRWAKSRGFKSYYRIDLRDYTALPSPIKLSEFIENNKEAIRKELDDQHPKNYPFTRWPHPPGIRSVMGGYLTVCSSHLYGLLRNSINPKTSGNQTANDVLPHAVGLPEVLRRYHEEQIVFASSAQQRRYAVTSWDETGVNVERLDANEAQRVTFSQAEKLIRRVQDAGSLEFVTLDDTSAVRNTVLQAEALALTGDRKAVCFLADKTASLQNFLQVLDNLNMANPLYKPAMLLCVLDGIAEGDLPQNRITFDWVTPRFIAKMKSLDKDVTERETAQPFYHLSGDLFWMHAVQNLNDLMQDGGDGPAAARNKIKYALIKDTYWSLLQDPPSRAIVRRKLETLIMPKVSPDKILPAAEIAIEATGFLCPLTQVGRLLSSIISKPFVILTGNSGTGKTKLAQLIAHWLTGIDTDPQNGYAVVPVGADWTDNRNIVGFVNHLRKDDHQNPLYQSTPVLDLLLRTQSDPTRPYFLILDEMNLSHVERYFSDFLSAMESKKPVPLHNERQDLQTAAGHTVSQSIAFPDNLFIIGTVNVDETTYMFSPKVLDRANVLEFRISVDDASGFLTKGASTIANIKPAQAGMAEAFLALSRRARGLELQPLDAPAGNPLDECQKTLKEVFTLLHQMRLEFAFRTIAEVIRYLHVDFALAPDKTRWHWEYTLDAQLLQKILPKLHGSRRRLEAVLVSLAAYCEKRDLAAAQEPMKKDADLSMYPLPTSPASVTFPLSRTKLLEMLDAVRRDQFVSFIQ